MPKTPALLPLLAILAVPAQAAPLPGSAAEGKKLHDANCLSCHDAGVYQRPNRNVKSIAGIAGQITACGHQTNVTLGKKDVDNLVKYLNDAYYQFK